MPIHAINPATDQPLQTYPEHTPDQVASIIQAAHEAFVAWRTTSFTERAVPMRRLAVLLRERAPALARLMAQEMGKPVAQGKAEAEKCAATCDFYAEHAQEFLEHEFVTTDAKKSYIAFDPLGVVLAVMPWNFPFWQVFRCAAPTLMAGDAIVLKHASNVPGCALAAEQLTRDAGFPANLFRTALVGSAQVPAMIAHPLVRAVTLTGSTPAGQSVASQAGAALKKTVLELGGSDPYIILEDADLGQAVEACVLSRLQNTGQSCVAAKRFIVTAPIRAAFEQRFVELMRAKPFGDPLSDATLVGPMARRDLRDGLHEQVQRSLERGARLLLGGTLPSGPGAFYPPTVLTDVKPGMPAYDEEFFGPVASIIPVKDEAEAIRVANDSPFGLGAAVFTKDRARGERIVAQLDAGCCFVNTHVRSDPRLPFGGVKASGYGRELSSFGIREFVNIKTVYVV